MLPFRCFDSQVTKSFMKPMLVIKCTYHDYDDDDDDDNFTPEDRGLLSEKC